MGGKRLAGRVWVLTHSQMRSHTNYPDLPQFGWLSKVSVVKLNLDIDGGVWNRWCQYVFLDWVSFRSNHPRTNAWCLVVVAGFWKLASPGFLVNASAAHLD